MYDIKDLKGFIKSGNKVAVKWLMNAHSLIVKDGKLVAQDKSSADYYKGFWHQRQQARKILLNSLYGALLNESMKFYDKRVGQSVTLTGRSIVRHMNARINEIITGEYDYRGDAIKYSDTDSFFCQDKIYTNNGEFAIGEFFDTCNIKWKDGEKEYACDDRFKALTFDPKADKALFRPFNYVYRHKVSKQKWRITDESGNQVTVTSDHSVMVERMGVLIELKPRDILESDILITVKRDDVYNLPSNDAADYKNNKNGSKIS
jgi:hypothetical protein